MVLIARRVSWTLVTCAAAAGLLYLLFLGRGRTYALDEWMWVADRRSFSVDTLLTPHNGNLTAFPVAVYLAVFHVVGLNHPEIFRILVIACHLGIAVLVALLVSRRHGWTIAASAGLLVMFLGRGAANIVWGFQIGMSGSVLFFLLAVWFVDRWETEPASPRLIFASIGLSLSVLSSSVGICAIAAMVALVFLSDHRGKIWWVPVPAAAVYAIWWLGYQEGVAITRDPFVLGRWIWSTILHVLGGFFDSGQLVGALTLVIVAGWTGWHIRNGHASRRMLVWTVFLGTFFVLTALTRSFSTGNAPRFLHVSMISMVLLLSDAGPENRRPRRWPRLAVVAIATTSIALQFSYFRAYDTGMRVFGFSSPQMRGLLAAAELLPFNVATAAPVVTFLGEPLVTVGEYLNAVEGFGSSPAYPVQELAKGPLSVRIGADNFLNTSGVVTLVQENPIGCNVGQSLSSITLTGGQTEVVKVDEASEMILHRFTDPTTVVGGWRDIPFETVRITVPKDSLEVPWVMTFSAPVEHLDCGVP